MTQSEALNILKTGANVFLTGEPGSGKTHTINEYIKYLNQHHIDPAITASTGIAATHIGGITIHSWSGIGIKNSLNKYDLDKISSTEYVSKRIRRTHVLIIDEVSMLSGKTLSMVDAVCREVRQDNSPFGGLQIIFVGDFFQLPPIMKNNSSGNNSSGNNSYDNNSSDNYYDSNFETEGRQNRLIDELPDSRFACDSPAWQNAKPVICYLTEQYRQDDSVFTSILSSIRKNNFTEEHLIHIEKRKIIHSNAPTGIPKLFSHNVAVDQVNDDTLEKINSEKKFFEMTMHGPMPLVTALIKGCLSPEKLALKIGASVMFTKNNPREGYINGTLGTVTGFSRTSLQPLVKTVHGATIEASPLEWTIEENGSVKAKITQLPLRLAWAITVHKSQGMSLDAAVMDLSKVFEYGQGYVALSRVRRLSGLHLLGWNSRAFQVHPEILEKDESFRFLSDNAENEFGKISKKELSKMHKDFIKFCGGKK
ncbi:MAG TPA: PIF1 family DEAD/DEAH box helicase [Candidatus Paceibacterota bacterium]|nr:PIF1 family DEAD/DEAH box helicase [Candidatus Paceibacterota bacterium]